MVQIHPARQSLGGALGGGFSSAILRDLQRRGDEESQMRLIKEKAAQERQNQQEKFSNEFQADSENYKIMENVFGKKFADVWLATGQGERTQLTKAALEARARGIDLEQFLGEMPKQNSSQEPNRVESEQPIPEKKLSEKDIFKEIQTTLKQEDEGLLPEEKIARGKERFSTGLKEYQEAGTKLRGMTRDKERLDILQDLNKSKTLPKNLGRLNVDKEGNLKLPFLGSPESQRYVKTLNEFSSGAKDTFGSRVTNFDLAQYLKRYPTLLNTEEGRRQLLEQMKIVNQINSVYYKNLKNVYDRAGGVRNIDADVAERYAEQLSEQKIDGLTEKFKQIGQFSSKPAPSEFKGKKIRDKETGEIFISDGENWIPAE